MSITGQVQSIAAALTRARDPQIETMRGLACVLLVAFHVVGTSDTGMHVLDGSFWRSLVDIMTPIRMPLFAFISGYVLTLSVANLSDFKASFSGKLRRLGLPLLTVTMLFNLIYGATGMRHFVSSPMELYAYPYIHLWYLQSSILMMAIVMMAAFVTGAKNITVALVLFPLSLIASQIVPKLGTDLFSITGASYLLPFFCLGMIVRHDRSHFSQLLNTSTMFRKIILLMVMAGILLATLRHGWFATPEGKIKLLPIILSCVLCLCVYSLRLNIRWLAWIGSHSYAIFLFHPIFSSVSRHVLQASYSDTPQMVIFFVGLVCGVVLPIATGLLILRNQVTALLMLGIPFSKYKGSRVVVWRARKRLTDSFAA